MHGLADPQRADGPLLGCLAEPRQAGKTDEPRLQQLERDLLSESDREGPIIRGLVVLESTAGRGEREREVGLGQACNKRHSSCRRRCRRRGHLHTAVVLRNILNDPSSSTRSRDCAVICQRRKLEARTIGGTQKMTIQPTLFFSRQTTP